MNIKTMCLLVAVGLAPRVLFAEETNLQAQIDDINEKIKVEEEANQQLKDEVAAREKKIAELEQKLEALEKQEANQAK